MSEETVILDRSDCVQQIRIVSWAIDFCRAMFERPKIIRLLLKVLMGQYAYREFYGLMQHSSEYVEIAIIPYGLEFVGYHKDKVPADYNQAAIDEYKRSEVKE